MTDETPRQVGIIGGLWSESESINRVQWRVHRGEKSGGRLERSATEGPGPVRSTAYGDAGLDDAPTSLVLYGILRVT
jgi:hypothetical protein